MSKRTFLPVAMACAFLVLQVPRATFAAADPMGFEAGFAPSTGANPSAIASADFDRDGRKDLAVTSYAGNTVQILRGDDSPFAPGATYATGKNPVSVAAGDLNGDGAPDLIVANYGSHNVAVYLNDGKG